MKYDVFISYSRKDMSIALKVCDMLNRYARYYKFEYFFDKEEIKSQNEYLKHISNAIAQSRTVLFLASKDSYASVFCSKELLFADKRGVRIHQYCIDESKAPNDIELLLGTHQYRDIKSTSIEDMVREVLSDSLESEIKPISELEELKRKEEEAKHRQEATLAREKQAKLNMLKSRILEIQEQIILNQQKITKLEREKLEIEQQVSQLEETIIKPIIPQQVLDDREVITPVTTYKVGDYYNENGKRGVVFEVWDGGKHGKIVSLDETRAVWDSRVKWNSINRYSGGTRTYADSESDGKENTDKIMARTDRQYFDAFEWCRAKGSSWYLPAKDELKQIYNNIDKLNSTLSQYGTALDGCYWSSTGYVDYKPEVCAWLVNVNNGNATGFNKSANYYVRAVSAF